MPPTGRAVAKKLGVDNFNSQMLFQPELNVRFGSWYMKQLMERFKHISQVEDVEYIVSGAYNSGPDPVEGWIEKYGAKDIDEFIEDIPYRETRNHIKKVMDGYQIYKEIYGSGNGMDETGSYK
jgi:soluble lytic murein transglycosylase